MFLYIKVMVLSLLMMSVGWGQILYDNFDNSQLNEIWEINSDYEIDEALYRNYPQLLNKGSYDGKGLAQRGGHR